LIVYAGKIALDVCLYQVVRDPTVYMDKVTDEHFFCRLNHYRCRGEWELGMKGGDLIIAIDVYSTRLTCASLLITTKGRPIDSLIPVIHLLMIEVDR
jgi:hypothetical protein